MSKIRAKADIYFELDSEDYAVPADGRLTLQLREDIKDAIESNLAIEVNQIKVVKTGGKNAEVRNTDYD